MERKIVGIVGIVTAAIVVLSLFGAIQTYRVAQFESENYARQSTINGLQSALQNSTATIEQLIRTVQSLTTQLQNASITMQESERVIETLKLKQQIDNSTIQQLAKTIEDLGTKLQNATLAAQESERVIETLKLKQQIDNSTIQQLTTTIQSLTTQLQNASITMQESERVIENLKEEITRLKEAKLVVELRTVYHGKFWPWDSEYHEVIGTVTNIGVNKAYNIVIKVHWQKQTKDFHSETFTFQELDGDGTHFDISTAFNFNDQEDYFYCDTPIFSQ